MLSGLIEERIFGGNRENYLVWKNSPSDAARLIWEGNTQNLKLSSFAEGFFRQLA